MPSYDEKKFLPKRQGACINGPPKYAIDFSFTVILLTYIIRILFIIILHGMKWNFSFSKIS